MSFPLTRAYAPNFAIGDIVLYSPQADAAPLYCIVRDLMDDDRWRVICLADDMPYKACSDDLRLCEVYDKAIRTYTTRLAFVVQVFHSIRTCPETAPNKLPYLVRYAPAWLMPQVIGLAYDLEQLDVVEALCAKHELWHLAQLYLI